MNKTASAYLTRLINQRGPLRFDEWMEHALYNPDFGFYSTGGQAGRAGRDFLTSPEVGPLFGEVLGRVIDHCWEQLEQPVTFTVVEAGAGAGTLAKSILSAKLKCVDALRYVAVERSAPLRQQAEQLLDATELFSITPTSPARGECGIVLANELLDNLPVRILERTFDQQFAQVHVVCATDKTGATPDSFEEILLPLSATDQTVATQLAPQAPVGARIPLAEQATNWVHQATELFQRGWVIVIDYGATTSELAQRGDWLRTYTGHSRGTNSLQHPGRQDITTDVAWDQLPTPTQHQTQADFLTQWGIQELAAQGAKEWHRNAANPNLESLKARSRVREAEALCDLATLGSYSVLQWEI